MQSTYQDMNQCYSCGFLMNLLYSLLQTLLEQDLYMYDYVFGFHLHRSVYIRSMHSIESIHHLL